jgi:hypothetical protein
MNEKCLKLIQDVVETKMMEKLKEEFAKLLSTQNEQHQQEKAQLEVMFVVPHSLINRQMSKLISGQKPEAGGKVEQCGIADKRNNSEWSKCGDL